MKRNTARHQPPTPAARRLSRIELTAVTGGRRVDDGTPLPALKRDPDDPFPPPHDGTPIPA